MTLFDYDAYREQRAKRWTLAVLVLLALLAFFPCVARAQTTNFFLCWTNPPFTGATNWVTGVEASSDLRHWQRILLVPYAETNCYKLVGCRAQRQFYRVYQRTR